MMCRAVWQEGRVQPKKPGAMQVRQSWQGAFT